MLALFKAAVNRNESLTLNDIMFEEKMNEYTF